MRTVVIAALLMLVFQSCGKQRLSIDEVISKYDTVNFDGLKNRLVYRRSTSRGLSVYIVRTSEDTACAPYAVHFDEAKDVITAVINDRVIATCGEDYLTHNELGETMREYKKHGLSVVKVDSKGNVYMNPYQQESTILLRVAANSKPRDINEFTHYRGDWYKRK